MELDFKALAAGLLTAAVFAFAAHARDGSLGPEELTGPESCKATNGATSSAPKPCPPSTQ